MFSPKQQAVITARAARKSWKEAAKFAGVTERTVREWRQKAEGFEAAIDDAVLNSAAAARARITMRAGELVDALVDIGLDEKAPHSARVAAIDKALSRIGVVAVAGVEHSGEVKQPTPVVVQVAPAAIEELVADWSGEDE